MKIVYIANDGTQFNNEDDCIDYEWGLKNPEIYTINCFDWNGEKLVDIFRIHTYMYCHKIIIPTNKAAQQLSKLGKRNKWSLWRDFKKAGIYEYDNGFKKIEEG